MTSESRLNKQRNACIEDDRHEEGGYANIITKLSPFHMPCGLLIKLQLMGLRSAQKSINP